MIFMIRLGTLCHMKRGLGILNCFNKVAPVHVMFSNAVYKYEHL